MSAKTRLAQLIAKNEGFGVPGAIPTVRNNPGDLRHSPHSTHREGYPDEIGWIDTLDHGWDDLERQLQLYSIRIVSKNPRSRKDCPPHHMTLVDLAYVYAPPEDHNDTEHYLIALCQGLELPESATVLSALEVPAQ